MQELKIEKIEGIPLELFETFRELGLELKIRTSGTRAELQNDIVDFIIISTMMFPLDFIKAILIDQTKIIASKTKKKIIELWGILKSTNPAILKSNKDPEYKQPKLRIIFPISENENSVLELDNNIPDRIIEETINQYFELLSTQILNRMSEQEISSKTKMNINNKNN